MTPLKQIVRPPRQTPLADRTSALRSATTRLGLALSTSLESSTSARSSGRRSDLAPTISAVRPAASNPDMHTPPNCTRRATLVTRSSSSPCRRSSLPSSQTPRRGEKQKRQRRGHNAQHDVINGATLPNAIDLSVAIDDRSTRRTLSSNHRRTTDFLGWRRLHFDEIVSVRVRQSIIVVIPTDVRSDDDLIKKQRKLFKRRLVGHIASGFNDLCRDEVVAHLNEHHGVERNDSIYIELVCSVKAYGERDELMAGQNLEWHLGRGNSGMLLDLNDFPSEKSLQIKPASLSCLFRGAIPNSDPPSIRPFRHKP
jgi:hypothetical protein